MRSEGSKLLAAVEFTQREIATRIGVSQATVAMWISGDRVPSKDHRNAIAAAFGIRVTAWPRDSAASTSSDWKLVCDVIVRKLAERAPDLLAEIVAELENASE